MRKGLLAGILGRFLQIYSVLIFLPALLTLVYPEKALNFYLFTGTSLLSFTAGTVMTHFGSTGDPSIGEAMILTLAGWIFAVFLGAIPLTEYLPIVDALFEAASGLTTTGISMFAAPENLPHSILFWRSFMQWIGGLGILTFFIAVVKQSGGIAQRLFSAEAHKTDPGSIRPSLKKSVTDLWRVYGFLTTTLIGLFVALKMPVFEATIHAFSTLSTGGFSTQGASFAGYTPEIQAVATLFMVIGGINFVIMYRVLRSDYRPLRNNSEFKLYILIFALLTAVLSFDLMGKTAQPFVDSAFQSAAFISSTGFATMDIMIAAPVVQLILMAVMFTGGSVGSTAGGLKVFRIKTLYELLKTRLRAYSLPDTAVNKVKIDGAILENSTVKTISVLFFTWITVTFIASVALVGLEGYTFQGAVSVALSTIGNMGPVFTGSTVAEASIVSKIILTVAMIAGRLEMLPVLAIFNREIIKD